MEPLPCKAKDWSRQTRVTTKKGSKFRSDRWIVCKVLQLFLEAVFLVEEMESLLNEEQVSSSETSVMAQKHLNFWSDRQITPKFLQEFLYAIFLVVAMESLICEAIVRSRQTKVTT